MDKKKLLVWMLRIIPAVILLQTLRFKFTAHTDSVLIFSNLGVEPWGRIGLGVIELVTALAILYPKTTRKASLVSMVIMMGAIFSHLFVLGINFNGDGGLLFSMAIIVFTTSGLNWFFSRTKKNP